MTVKRPSKHQTEDRSRLAFGEALPPQWVLRNKAHDYGIDQEVEIFTEDGKSTGVVFLVQLKGTTSKDEYRQKGATLKLDTLEYYNQFELPVLIVRWVEQTNDIYIKWAHEIDPYKSIKNISKTVTIHFSEYDKWTKETPQTILTDIKRLRRAKSPELSLPIKLILNVSEDLIQGIQPYKIRKSIRELAARTNFALVDAPHSAEEVVSHVIIRKNEIEVRFAKAWGACVHGVEQIDDPSHEIPVIVFLGLAVALARCGHIGEAAKIIKYLISSAPKKSELIPYSLGILLRNGDTEFALDFISSLPDEFLSPHIAIVTHIGGLASIKTGAFPEIDNKFYSFLTRIITICEVDGPKHIVGTAHYNLGNYLKNANRFSWALHHYRAAAEYESDYLGRIYFNRELGGIFFMSRRYRHAARYYQRAIDLGGQNLRALLADSLMFSGQYQHALDHFTKHNRDDHSDLTAEFLLKEKVLTEVIKLRGLRNQNRQPHMATKLATIEESHTNEDNIARLENILLKHDAINGLTNFNLGILYGKEGHHYISAISFLIEAFNITTDVESWRNAFLHFLNAGECYTLLAKWTAITAHYFCNEKFLAELIAFRDGTQHPAEFDQLINIVDSILSDFSRSQDDSNEIEIRGIGANYTTSIRS